MSKLTAITIFQDRASEVESTLTALYEHHDLPLELIIINDGSKDETSGIIQSIVEYFQHEETYYFEHETPIGYGRSLNEALLNATGDVIWTPENADEINLDKVTTLLEHLSKFPYAGASILSPDVESLGITGDVGPLPADQSFFWNWNVIPAKQRYFNPAMERGFGYELWLRIGRPRLWKMPVDLFKGSTKWNFLDLNRSDRNELRYALLQGGADNRDQARIVEQQIEFIQRKINVLEIDSEQQEESAEHTELIEKAQNALRDGNYSVSLDAVERVLREDPLHKKALILKIQLLERMRRYVEASELKFTLKAAGGHLPDENVPETDPSNKQQPDEAEEPDFQSQVETSETPDGPSLPSDADINLESEKELPSEELDSDGDTSPESEPITETSDDEPITISLIIPVTGVAKSRLEHCLHSLHQHEKPTGIELIIIDNATIDDTPNYLDQLQSDHFLNCRVLTNSQNAGFAKALNQGIDEAQGEYICAIHDDIEFTKPVLHRLQKLLDDHREFGAAAPLTDYTLNLDQVSERAEPGRSDELIETEYLDSFCLMFRNTGIRFDEAFGAAYFEDIDFSFQLREKGSKVGVSPGLWIHHVFGGTTTELGIPVKSPRYWENAEYFHQKWNMEISFPGEQENAPDLDKLLIINELINPYYPEPHLKQLFEDLFTSELRTNILENKWPKDVLLGLVQLMMKMEVRDVLRTLEEELRDVELEVEMLYELAYFYYRHNIFSRSRFYISEYPADVPPFHFQLLELEMLLAEKEVEDAVELLTSLLEENPSHPDLYRISGELHSINGDEKEAVRFFELASQIDPYRYSEKKKAFG